MTQMNARETLDLTLTNLETNGKVFISQAWATWVSMTGSRMTLDTFKTWLLDSRPYTLARCDLVQAYDSSVVEASEARVIGFEGRTVATFHFIKVSR
jgi:hypothetical protein